MSRPTTRRGFLRTAAAGGAFAGLGDLGFIGRLRPLSAAETKLEPGKVQFQPEIEPLVRLLEDTPREKLLTEVAGKIHGGTTYPEILAALQLAGIRNVQPRPSVGFKFHAVLVVNSAHLASLSSPDEHRWLPIFWAIDHFKESQAADVREGDWTMQAVDESAVPPADKAEAPFIEAMDQWDEGKADAAAAALARSGDRQALFNLFSRFGSRDFRSIGHKAIYVANGWRTLDAIGWQHAEPILRSLAYAMLAHEDGNPAKDDLPADRPGRENVERAAKIREGWQQGEIDSKATADLLSTLHDGSPGDCCEQIVELLNRKTAPQSIWDALFVGAGELLARQPGIVGLHAVTSTNALHYAFNANTEDRNRRLLLLQNAAFLSMFHSAMQGRGKVADTKLAELEPAPLAATESEAVNEIFADVKRDPMTAARKTLNYATQHPDPKPLIDAARLLVFLKGNDAHDYKFSSAVLEDYRSVSPEWRGRYLAASMFNLNGSTEPDNRLVEKTRAALGA
ncbi:MAG TPA: hypothetical protein VN699_12600 [Pirellulales bacterium]|nr:hypothetical protein [Pirellulales bacterium]